jgi:penicillin amidase
MLRRAFKILLLLLLVAIAVLIGGVDWLFWRAQPVYAGTANLPGLSRPVRVFRDEHGVPHIFAATMNDAARALGYIHADERLFQMEMQRRAGAGRLSEILGEDMLDVDRFTRTLGFYRLAQDTYQTMSPEARQMFDAYADGVNAWLAAHRNTLPPEFLALGIKPENWVPADSLVWAKLMALQLSDNYKHEILRARLAQKLAPAQMQLLFMPLADTPITTAPKHVEHAERQGDDAFEKLGVLTGLGQGASNEWVVGGDHTDSGKPILANDPHLGLEAPVLWYLARIVTPDLSLEGATVPGLPVVLLGQNDHIAWGFTTTGSDVEDLFVETVNPHNGNQYAAPNGFLPFSVRDETIRVKGKPAVDLKVRETRHGPVLSDIDPDLAALAGDGKVMALAFTALRQNDATPEALLRIDRAANWQQFMDALQLYRAPPQNIVYADTAGNIGFVAAGIVPQRQSGKGLVPADGALGANDWITLIPFARWPHVYNPPAGFVFNANNAVVPPDSADYYGEDWEEPFRAERLQQWFDSVDKHTLETSAKMQADIVSLAARQILPYLLKQKFAGARETQALGMLGKWDGVMDKNRPEPLIFEAWLYELHKIMFTDRLDDPLKALGPYNVEGLLAILGGNASLWCQQQACEPEIMQAFTAALDLLTQRDGADMSTWRWGDEHVTVLRHKFYQHVPLFDRLTELDAPSSGDFYTLDRGGSSVTDPKHPFERTHGGGFRGIYDLSDPSRSRFMIATGESGHVFTRHYGDLVKPWNDVESFTLSGTESELKARGLPELDFNPGK